MPLKKKLYSIFPVFHYSRILIFQYSSIAVHKYYAPYSSAISPLRMLAVKQQKPEVQQLILMITTLMSDNNDGNNNLCIKGMFWVLIMINVQIWDRVARLMDHLEERRAEDK